MNIFYTFPPVSPACWSPDLGITLEEATKIFKAYRREVRVLMNECKEANFYPDKLIWWEFRLEEECVKEEEQSITSDEEEDALEESEVNKKYGEEESRQLEDDLVLDENTDVKSCIDVDIRQENLQNNSIPKNYFNKADERQEIDKVLDFIYALFTKIPLKMTWKQHHQYLKFMGLLPNKIKKKDDVFFVSYMPS
ncbi:unnamed protein product [Lathyrus sativus]|nr:unnamed protein product [Lathyrus sativus]